MADSQRTAAIRATYRLQFHEKFRLPDALAIIPYLADLGISHIYASPLTKACEHSTHGYDVCDYTQLNPDLGIEADLERLLAALRSHNMGLVLDIVPNHMAASAENPWWMDALAKGRNSKFACYFDIDWESSDPQKNGKVVLPVLGMPYRQILAERQIKLRPEGGDFFLCYGEQKFPVTAGSLPSEHWDKVNEDPAALDELIQRQHYRLEFWKNGDTELNYRRFFTITSLAGVRMEDPRVFDDAHQLIKTWVGRGWIDGLRVDHPDGLRDPAAYLQRLHKLAPHAWIVVEKILLAGEALPTDWPVAGTTGYDFMDRVNSVLIHLKSGKAFSDFYAGFASESLNYSDLVHSQKRVALNAMFQAETHRLMKILLQIAARDPRWRTFSVVELRDAIVELAACFTVYRIYGTARSRSLDPKSRHYLEEAIDRARRNKPSLSPVILELLNELLSVRGQTLFGDEFADRFQQLTGPAMAKSAEDSAFYCYNRLISLNEVGGDPGRFGLSVKDFHGYCAGMQAEWPEAMLGTSTHDTKRGEDARARLNVLSEMPEEWNATVQSWAKINQTHHTGQFPDRNAEYFIYQTLVGSWPISEERLQAFLQKAAREAGQHTNWHEPMEEYEIALRHFISGVLREPEFIASLERFVYSIERAGHVNSLTQTLIKLTAPGIPDIYQGCELWNFSVVDPDNRRPVDYEQRQSFLTQVKDLSAEQVWHHSNKSLAKLWLIWKVLNFRKTHPKMFADDVTYESLPARGKKHEHVIAYLRGKNIAVVTQRLPMTLQDEWMDTSLYLPKRTWQNHLTGEAFYGPVVQLKQLLAGFPVALLFSEGT